MSNATLDKDTLTKAPGNARMTISKRTISLRWNGRIPLGRLKISVTCVVQNGLREKAPNKTLRPFQQTRITHVTQIIIGKEPPGGYL